MRTYTGPTIGGGTATVQCPDWCTTDHEYWEDRVDDMCHESATAEIVAPRDRAGYVSPGRALQVPLVSARLSLHSTQPGPSAACVWLAPDEIADHAVELDLKGVDALLGQLDGFRERLADLRDTLARIDKDRRQTAA